MKSRRIIIFLIFVMYSQSKGQGGIDFSTSLLSDEKVKLSEVYSSGLTLVTFWALWCKPCRAEMKVLGDIYKKYLSQGFKILAINQDTPRSSEKVKSFVESLSVEYMIALDPNKEISEQFNVQAIPLSLLINRQGRIVYRHSGYLPGDEHELEEEIKKALSEN